MALGRISGPLLKANLLRQGVDLAFETDLLYLDVNNSRIGINTASPQYDLDVNGTIKSTGLNISTLASIADLTISGSTISTTEPTLNLGTADTVVYQNRLTVDSIDIENNIISTNNYDSAADVNLELRPNGTGTVEIFADTNVYGNIVATGSITADGNITIGDADTDNVTFNAEIDSNIIDIKDDKKHTKNGLHLANTGGAFLMVLKGLLGIHTIGGLSIKPAKSYITEKMHYEFIYQNQQISVEIAHDYVMVSLEKPIKVKIYNKTYENQVNLKVERL